MISKIKKLRFTGKFLAVLFQIWVYCFIWDKEWNSGKWREESGLI
jgi:hypothetical protein